jgi:hypothetical protein
MKREKAACDKFAHKKAACGFAHPVYYYVKMSAPVGFNDLTYHQEDEKALFSRPTDVG